MIKQNINSDSYKHYPMDDNGLLTESYEPGDFVLIRHTNVGFDFIDKCIAFGQSLRFKGAEKSYTHAALLIGNDGSIIEALAEGVKRNNISKYKGFDFTLVKINASQADREEMVDFAVSCLGDGYGWSTILSIALSLLTGLKFSFGFDGTEICSGLVASALFKTTAIFPRDPSHITPADLASYYSVVS
ncbi:MAG: hypothetical protein KGJ07_01560 [Patescibacteria group bacterium]|nr:hypothetical protein [Patescibacteria group bacterium]